MQSQNRLKSIVSEAPVEAQLREDMRDAMKNPADDSKLPKVLLIGDSISIGYTIPVRQILQGKAAVYRPPVNCQHTAYGLQNLKAWLGPHAWSVIHFNWGIWDTHYLDMKTGDLVQNEKERSADQLRIRHPLAEYRRNLNALVEILAGTGAHLIWASSTPIMFRTGSRFEDLIRYNGVAAEVMKEHGIPINDLYRSAFTHAAEWQAEDRCHFNDRGNLNLGQQVSRVIRDVL